MDPVHRVGLADTAGCRSAQGYFLSENFVIDLNAHSRRCKDRLIFETDRLSHLTGSRGIDSDSQAPVRADNQYLVGGSHSRREGKDCSRKQELKPLKSHEFRVPLREAGSEPGLK